MKLCCIWLPVTFLSAYSIGNPPFGLGSASGSVVKESTCQCRSCRRFGLNPGSGRSPGEGKGDLLQYSCLKISMDRGAWGAIVHGAGKGQTWLSTHHTPFELNVLCYNNRKPTNTNVLWFLSSYMQLFWGRYLTISSEFYQSKNIIFFSSGLR